MSNLVKQSYVIDMPKEDTRVIDSNDLIELRLQELRLALVKENLADGESGKEGFVEGLAAQEIAAGPTQEEILESAREEAKNIVDDAKSKADQIHIEAEQKAKLLFEEQKAIGFKEGSEKAKTELEAARQTLEAKLQAQLAEHEAAYQNRMETLEGDLVEAIIQVFDRVFRVQFEDKREILLALVNNTISNIDSGKHFRIHVCLEDIPLLEDHLDEIQKTAGYDAVIEIVKAANMQPGECQIETDYGMFDCGLDTELKNLYKDIRSLCV